MCQKTVGDTNPVPPLVLKIVAVETSMRWICTISVTFLSQLPTETFPRAAARQSGWLTNTIQVTFPRV